MFSARYGLWQITKFSKRAQSDKDLRDKPFKIADDPKYDGYQTGLASMVYKFFDKKSSGSGVATEPNYQLTNELHKQIIRKSKRRKIYSSFKGNIWGCWISWYAIIKQMQQGIKYLLQAIDLFGKYARVVFLKSKRRISIVNTFPKVLDRSNRKPNKIWVDQWGEFYNNFFKRVLKINNIEMYSTYNKGKSVIAERFIKTLKNKIFKHMRAISKNVYLGVLDDIVNKYNNTVHRTIKMKAIDVKSDSYTKYNEDSNEKDLKFRVVDRHWISKYKNWWEEVFVVSKIKNTVPWT